MNVLEFKAWGAGANRFSFFFSNISKQTSVYTSVYIHTHMRVLLGVDLYIMT